MSHHAGSLQADAWCSTSQTRTLQWHLVADSSLGPSYSRFTEADVVTFPLSQNVRTVRAQKIARPCDLELVRGLGLPPLRGFEGPAQSGAPLVDAQRVGQVFRAQSRNRDGAGGGEDARAVQRHTALAPTRETRPMAAGPRESPPAPSHTDRRDREAAGNPSALTRTDLEP